MKKYIVVCDVCTSYNNATKRYVMWMTLDDASHSLGLAAVALAVDPLGPFYFQHTVWPEGNRTFDIGVSVADNGTGVLIRTYYATTHFVLPEPVSE